MTTHPAHSTRARLLLAVLVVVLLLLLASATAARARHVRAPERPAERPAPALVAPADTVTAAQVALGDSVFHGRVGGAICATCHGQDARGIAGLAPDLTDATWLHGDGGLPFLATIIKSGVAKPKKVAGMMPPYGGIPLSDAHLQAVAAYVWSLSHKPGA